MSRSEFARIKAEVDRMAPEHVQAFVLTWAAPYRVDCMSITSAFAFGFDEQYCAQGCRPTKASPYHNSRGFLLTAIMASGRRWCWRGGISLWSGR